LTPLLVLSLIGDLDQELNLKRLVALPLALYAIGDKAAPVEA